jgi:hypothetical protein
MVDEAQKFVIGLRRPGVKGVFDHPEHLLPSFHPIIIVEVSDNLPTLPSL